MCLNSVWLNSQHSGIVEHFRLIPWIYAATSSARYFLLIMRAAQWKYMLDHCFIKKKDGSPHQYFHSVSIEDLTSGYATESRLGCGNLITHTPCQGHCHCCVPDMVLVLGPCQGHSNNSVHFLPCFFSAGELWFPKIKSLR